MSGIKLKNRVIWDEAKLSLLGTMFDVRVAAIVGCDGSTASRKRIKEGIPQYKPPRTDNFPSEYEPLLGTMLDSELVKISGISQSSVRNARLRRGIPLFRDRMWTPHFVSKLGKMSDAKLAKEMGIHPKKVRKFRRRLNIPPSVLYCIPKTKKKLDPYSDEVLQKMANELWKLIKSVNPKKSSKYGCLLDFKEFIELVSMAEEQRVSIECKDQWYHCCTVCELNDAMRYAPTISDVTFVLRTEIRAVLSRISMYERHKGQTIEKKAIKVQIADARFAIPPLDKKLNFLHDLIGNLVNRLDGVFGYVEK